MAATLDNDPAATAAASAALTALASLEGLSPGSLQTMMLEVSEHTLCKGTIYSQLATGSC